MMLGMAALSAAVMAVSGSALADEAEGSVDGVSYKVYLPDDYDEETRQYPSVYLMPSNGMDTDIYSEEALAGLLSQMEENGELIPMVIVAPQFSEGEDYREKLSSVTEEIESQYAVIPDARYRGILGVDVGGYMALETALVSKSELFYAAGSVMGDFTGEANPYLAYGSVLEAADALDQEEGMGYAFLQDHYFYIEGPNGSADTTVEGGTSDIGASLEKKTNPYYQYGGYYYLYATPDTTMTAFTVNDGIEDEAYALEGLSRALNCFSAQFSDHLIEGSFVLDPQVISVEDTASSVGGSITLSEEAAAYTQAGEHIVVTVSMLDPEDGSTLYEASEDVTALTAGADAQFTFSLPLDQKAEGTGTTVQLSAEYMGMQRVLGSKTLVAIQQDGETEDTRLIDLMGSWYFRAYKEYREGDTSVEELDQIENIIPETYESWGLVQPCLGWWTQDFDDSLNGQDNFGGYAWYVRTFDVPEDFPAEDLVLAAGYFDEANEVYVNGSLVGSTGMDYSIAEGIGVYDGSNPWDTNCVYELDASVLRYGETNTIAIRMCNSSGGGGWYEGPVGIYSQTSYDHLTGAGSGASERFYEDSYQSEALGSETATYRIYLPEGYLDEGNEQTYPVLYLLHGINSQSKTFEIDRVDQYFDQAIAEGAMEPMIVVMPDDPTKQSFWQGQYADMVTDDLIPEIDAKYRTISDKASRYIAGCSMGGGGAVSVGLNHPELFSGIISFYGALEYVDALQLAETMDAETLGAYRIYMTCGNQDMYNFYASQEQMSRLLTEKGVEHYHEVGNGKHESAYYLPRLIEAINYVAESR